MKRVQGQSSAVDGQSWPWGDRTVEVGKAVAAGTVLRLRVAACAKARKFTAKSKVVGPTGPDKSDWILVRCEVQWVPP